MPGLPAKALQLLSARLDGDDSLLTTPSPEALVLGEVLAILKAETPYLVDNMDEIEPAFATASLGQVHRVRLKSRKVIAVKVLYPDVDLELKKQLQLLLGAFRFGPPRMYGLNVAEYDEYFSEKFAQEVDYLAEARTQALFLDTYSDLSPGLVIPQVYPQFSSARVLAQDYEESLHLDEIKLLPEAERTDCAQQLVTFMLLSVFKKGLIHCDLHRANWGYRRESRQLVLYDFGSAIQLSSSQILAFHELLSATQARDNAGCLSSLESLGFDVAKLMKIHDRLAELCSRLLSPLLSSSQAKSAAIGVEIEELLGADKWHFRVSGSPWFLLLMRSVNFALRGVEELRVQVDLKAMLESVLQRPLGGIDRRAMDVEFPARPMTQLFVSVSEKGRELVALELPAVAIDELESLIPEETYRRLIDLGHNLEDAKKRVQQSHYSSQIVFEGADPVKGRHYKVWIANKK